MKKVKILYLIPHLENVSPVTQLSGMIKHLDYEQFEPIIVSFFRERTNSVQSRFEKQGIRVINLNLKRGQVFRQKTELKRVVREIQPQLIHSCSILTDSICASATLTIPWIITLHSFIYEDLFTRYGRILGYIMCKREERAIKNATRVITCSYSLKEKYQNRIRREYVAIQNGIDTKLWKNDTGLSKIQLREKLNIPKDAFVVLSTNMLDAIKDPLLLIKSFKSVRIPNAHLIMLGTGKMEEECRKHSSNKIVFTGRVNNVKEYLYASDVVVSASKSEGLPYAVLEAACTGIKMILSDIPQHIEVAEEMAYFFSVGDGVMLTEVIEKAYDQKEQCAKYDLSGLTAKAMSDKYQKIYSMLV